MRKHYFFSILLFIPHIAWAILPLDFTAASAVNNMAVGQVQVLHYTIQNNVNNHTLPLRSISVINDGDNEPSSLTSTSTTCHSTLSPHATCDITVTISNPQVGHINRHLNIDYNGRTPLVSPLSVSVSQAKYTVLMYMVGSDLESKSNLGTANIAQMMQIGSTANMNVILETGGANKPGWTTVKRKIVLHDNVYELQDLGSISMATASTIQDFIEWGVAQYPSEKYIIVFWDHGGGPNGGFGGDETKGGAATPINQLVSAIKAATLSTNKTFEIIGFDACLLGNAETVAGLYPYSHYLVGSEDLEPGDGWQYNTLLNYITTNPTANGLAIGTEIVNGYTAQNQNESTTLSVIDSSEMPNVISAAGDFATALTPYISSISNWKNVAKGRLKAPDYSTSVWDNESFDLVDLVGLANAMPTIFPSDTTLLNASNSFVDATQNAVKYYKNSANRGASYGLTLYFPSILAAYETGYPAAVTLNGTSFFSTTYVNFIQSYHNFYNTQSSNLIATPSSLLFNGTDYTAVVSNDFEKIYAAVGNDTCTNVFNTSGTLLSPRPCYTSIQYSNIQSTAGGGNTWDISFNKAQNISSWPLINNVPVLLIPNDTTPNIPNELTFIIPVTRKSDSTDGYLNVMKDSNNNYSIVGFQGRVGSANTAGKLIEIANGDQFTVRTFSDNGGTWGLFRTDTLITAPFTISFGTVSTDFNAFRFLVADLTGALNITTTSVAY